MLWFGITVTHLMSGSKCSAKVSAPFVLRDLNRPIQSQYYSRAQAMQGLSGQRVKRIVRCYLQGSKVSQIPCEH